MSSGGQGDVRLSQKQARTFLLAALLSRRGLWLMKRRIKEN